MSTRTQQYVNEVVMAAPAGSVTAMHWLGIALQDWVLMLSGLLIILQVFFLIRREVYKPWKDKRGN
jgi:hypothetical protein